MVERCAKNSCGMNAGTGQVIVAYETLGLSVEQIAGQLDMELGEVVASLQKYSRKYQSETRHADGPNPEIEGTEYNTLKRRYELLSEFAEDEHVREKALRWLMNEARGRNDLPERLIRLKERQVGAQEVDVAMRLSQFNNEIKRTRRELDLKMAS